MGSQLKDFTVPNLVGGLNTYSNKTQVADNESPSLMNVDFTGLQAIRKASGYEKLTSDAEVATGKRIRGIASYISDTVREVIYVAGTNIYKYDNAGDSAVITGAAATLTDDLDTEFVQMGNKLYILNGTDSLRYYEGTEVITTDITGAPASSTTGVNFNRRLYINSTAYKDRVYYSNPMTIADGAKYTGDFTDNPGASKFGGMFGFGTGKEIVHLIVQPNNSNAMYIFTRNEIYRATPVYGTGSTSSDHSFTIISASLGCRASKSCVAVNNDIYFLGPDGVYSLGEVANYSSVRTLPVSGKISTLITTILATQLDRCSAVFYKQRYYLSVSYTGSAMTDLLIMDTRYKAWTRWNFIKSANLLAFEDSNNANHLYFGSDDSSKSYIYEAEIGYNADTEAIDAYYYTKEFDLDNFDVSKLFFYWSILFGPLYGIVTVTAIIDSISYVISISVGTTSLYSDGVGSLAIGTFPIGLEKNRPDNTVTSTPSNEFKRHDLDSIDGYALQFKFANSSVDEQFQIEQVKFAYKPLPARKIDSSNEI